MALDTPAFEDDLQAYWKLLNSGFPQVKEVFAGCMTAALESLSADGIQAYLESAGFLGRMGRGVEPILVFLEVWPKVAAIWGEISLTSVMATIHKMQRSPNSQAIVPFLQVLPAVARRLHSTAQMQDYFALVLDFMGKTTGSVHGTQATFASPGLPEFLQKAPQLVAQLSAQGLKNWVSYGVKYYSDHPDHQREYFSLQSADSRAVLQRERHGTLLADNERQLGMYLRALWQDDAHFVPYSTGFDALRKQVPYFDEFGIRLPDVYDEERGVGGLNRYRAALAHIAAHRRWSTPIFADNFSPLQRMAIEAFEDARVEFLAMREYPGLRNIFLALHPAPLEEACDPQLESAIRHRIAMLSRAILDANHPYKNSFILDFAQRFHALMQQSHASTQQMAELAVLFIAKTRLQSDQLPNVHFKDTEVDYRDDNRHLWRFHEESDDEEMFEQPPQAAPDEELEIALPPRHYHEWDYSGQSYRPDWVSVYESLHPAGNAADIDHLLAKHEALAKRLKRLLELLKPQNKVRIRYQEEGSELDLDVALRSLIDYKSGSTPDPRINMSHQNDGRDIAVMLLLDLSESLGNKAAGSEQTILELSREAVSLLAWAIDQLGDAFAIAGFHSNTRHEVRYLHIKGFSEAWDEQVKGRLAAMEAGYSTRMGAAMRHTAHYLQTRKADKKLLLILTDGEPADIDSKDAQLLIQDAHKAVQELDQQGIYSYCINLDAKADAYVSDIFGNQYTVIDNVQRLPEKLPQLFMALTK
ncbi:MAG: VWA domain-containing protein [Methylophilaceae bacterium]|nr:VWA domain-containing protein [Methylophilaceae bacterium]